MHINNSQPYNTIGTRALANRVINIDNTFQTIYDTLLTRIAELFKKIPSTCLSKSKVLFNKFHSTIKTKKSNIDLIPRSNLFSIQIDIFIKQIVHHIIIIM